MQSLRVRTPARSATLAMNTVRPRRLRIINQAASVTVVDDSKPEPSRPEPDLSGLKVFVAGATGGTGKKVVEQLQAKGATVRALARDTSKAVKALEGSTKIEIVKGDVYQYATLPAAIGDCDYIICCTGANDFKDPLAPFSVDYMGTANLVAVARQKRVKKFILVSSIGADELLNPLNLFWGVLFWKKRGEEEVQRSGIDYTIVRPGGLKNKLRDGEPAGNIVMKGPNVLGTPPAKKSGSILRSQVAEVCIAALKDKEASNKVVEVIAESSAPQRTISELFKDVTF